jgi:hypothetical protein
MVALLMFGATDRGEHRQAAGAIAEAVTLGPTRPDDDIPAQVVERHAEAHINRHDARLGFFRRRRV